jgi:murein DD-endopeptidase MepM/ murein hydrolase activator NlpD
MSRVINKILSILNKNHLTMILVLMTLIIILPTNARAVGVIDYSKFDWDTFYEKNKNYWTDMCEGNQDEEACENAVMKYQKSFYTKLYKMLAKYQAKGLYISDEIILETVFFELFPSYTGNPETGQVYNSQYAIFGKTNNRSAIKVDEEDMDPDIEDNYNVEDQGVLDAMAEYYNNETDTTKTLVKNMIAYYTYCYGSYGDVHVEKLQDNSVRETCPDGGTPTTIIRHDRLIDRSIRRCAVNLSATTKHPGYELGFWKYYTSRIRYDTLFLGLIVKFFGVEIQDDYRTQCLAQSDSYPDGTYYTYVDQSDQDGAHVSTDKYFDFLKNSKYFDVKPHLQHRFQDVLDEAGVECLTNDTCENSLEAKGEYEKYQSKLEDDRRTIIFMIIDILNNRGHSISYEGYGSEEFNNTEYQRAERSGYYWPIGSDETEERDGILYADGTPAKTVNDVESYFGERKDPITGEKEMHYGIDITTEDGKTNIVAAYDGVVVSIVNNCTVGDYECNEGYGNTVIISHYGTGDFTVYAHLSTIDSQISEGTTVSRGEVLGKAGSTGKTKSSNLHYELRIGANTVNNAVDPLNNTPAGSQTPPSDDDLRPGGYSGSGIGAMSTKFDGCPLTKNEFVSKLSSYCAAHPNTIAQEMCDNPETVYDSSRTSNVNPMLVISRAMAEGNSPGISKHNYWGMGCTNTGGPGACITYSSLSDGIGGFARTVTKSATIAQAMSTYAYIGKNWYNPGSWSIGGCKYFSYIRGYMTDSRANTVASVCAKTTTCDTNGGDCTPTTQEDQDAYTSWQVEQKLGPYMHNVFGV